MSVALVLSVLAAAAAPQDPAPQAAAARAAAPTFTEHVAPIVFARCAPCHRPGHIAPFPLLGYGDVRKRAPIVREVVEKRFMPPWHPVPGHGSFRDSLRLSDGEVATVARWVETGCAEGPAAALPPLPEFPDGWHLGEPDLVVRMAAPFPVPAAGPDVYRNFAIPLELPADRWLTAIEVRPAARDVLHHVLFFLDATGQGRRLDGRDGRPGFRGMGLARQPSVGAWAVGGLPQHLPDGLAIPLPAGNDLILQCHFHPSGRAVEERLTIGLHFAAERPARTLVPVQLPPMFGLLAGIDIPAGDRAWRLQDSLELPCAVDAVTVGGHAHMLCRSMRMWAELPGADGDGRGEGGGEGGAPREVPLFRIDDWDFDWQNRYTFEAPVRLPAGAHLCAELVYDNSEDNAANPHSPPRRVRWGRESTDEMGSVTLMVVPADERDLAVLQRAVGEHLRRAAVARLPAIASGRTAAQVLERFDADRDGRLSRGEVPRRWQRLFDRLDGDGDGAVDGRELEALFGGGPGGR